MPLHFAQMRYLDAPATRVGWTKHVVPANARQSLIVMIDRPGRDSRQEDAPAADGKVVPIRSAQAARPAQLTLRQPLARFHILGAMRAVAWSGQNLLPRGRKAK